MSSGQNGKGDRPRNNWGHEWYEGYDAINWHRKEPEPDASTPADPAPTGPAKRAGSSRPQNIAETDQGSFPGE